jgi:hypothetical protein
MLTVLECRLILFLARTSATARQLIVPKNLIVMNLVSSNSVRVGGQHYALRSWHKTITKEPLVIEGSFNPNIDIVVDIAPIGK